MSAEVLQLVVEAANEGDRLDRYVADNVPDLSRTYAQRLIEAAQVLLNNRQARPSTPVHAGDTVTVHLPAPQPVGLVAEALPLQIVYEDRDVVVIDKPAGMVVHPAPGHDRGTLVNGLIARYPEMAINGDMRPGIVHRLDRDTSGLLVAARNERALRSLQAQQQARTMLKIYLAVVEGRMPELEGVIDAPIARHPTDRVRMAVVAGGRPARTHWRVLEDLGEYTLIEARLETGRTHQIRVHCASRNRPILGDPLYGPKRPRATFGLTRQFLHAHRLGFKLPSGGEWVEFTSPLPADLEAALARLRQSSRAAVRRVSS